MVSFVIDVKILIKEVVSNSCSLSIFVDSLTSVERSSFSSVDTDWVELSEGTLEVSPFEEVESIKWLVLGKSVNVVSKLDVLKILSKT